jgi:hypothetical protein
VDLGESNVKRALGWILEHLAADPRARRSELIDQASRQFDLTPLEADLLYAKLTEAKREPLPPSAPTQTSRPA